MSSSSCWEARLALCTRSSTICVILLGVPPSLLQRCSSSSVCFSYHYPSYLNAPLTQPDPALGYMMISPIINGLACVTFFLLYQASSSLTSYRFLLTLCILGLEVPLLVAARSTRFGRHWRAFLPKSYPACLCWSLRPASLPRRFIHPRPGSKCQPFWYHRVCIHDHLDHHHCKSFAFKRRLYASCVVIVATLHRS